MKGILKVNLNWRPFKDVLITPGNYRVPEDISVELANAAIAGGYAEAAVPASSKLPPENKVQKVAETKEVGGPTGVGKPASSQRPGQVKPPKL